MLQLFANQQFRQSLDLPPNTCLHLLYVKSLLLQTGMPLSPRQFDDQASISVLGATFEAEAKVNMAAKADALTRQHGHLLTQVLGPDDYVEADNTGSGSCATLLLKWLQDPNG